MDIRLGQGRIEKGAVAARPADHDDPLPVQVGPVDRLTPGKRVIPPAGEPHFGKILDLEMLIICDGKERTESEYRDLLAGAGFRLNRIVPTEAPVSVIEADPV